MDKIIDWLNQNREWLFSGIGVSAVAIVAGLFFKKNDKKEKLSEPALSISNRSENNPSIVINNHNTNSDNSSSHKQSGLKATKQLTEEEMGLASLQEKTNILFIDDDTSFKVVSILKESGWKNVSIVADVSFDDKAVKDAHILFVDIKGVGNKTASKDGGLGLAESLKQLYPAKKVILYSSETTGDRFHSALRKVDDFLPKDAEPYQFLSLVMDYSREISQNT